MSRVLGFKNGGLGVTPVLWSEKHSKRRFSEIIPQVFELILKDYLMSNIICNTVRVFIDIIELFRGLFHV